jgi:hypothetical protein
MLRRMGGLCHGQPRSQSVGAGVIDAPKRGRIAGTGQERGPTVAAEGTGFGDVMLSSVRQSGQPRGALSNWDRSGASW